MLRFGTHGRQRVDSKKRIDPIIGKIKTEAIRKGKLKSEELSKEEKKKVEIITLKKGTDQERSERQKYNYEKGIKVAVTQCRILLKLRKIY